MTYNNAESLQDALSEVGKITVQALYNVQNETLKAVMEIIEHEIELSGDGMECLPRIRKLYVMLNNREIAAGFSNLEQNTPPSALEQPPGGGGTAEGSPPPPVSA